MNHLPITDKRILAIDPTTRGFGFGILEAPERLIDWGVKEAKRRQEHPLPGADLGLDRPVPVGGRDS